MQCLYVYTYWAWIWCSLVLSPFFKYNFACLGCFHVMAHTLDARSIIILWILCRFFLFISLQYRNLWFARANKTKNEGNAKGSNMRYSNYSFSQTTFAPRKIANKKCGTDWKRKIIVMIAFIWGKNLYCIANITIFIQTILLNLSLFLLFCNHVGSRTCWLSIIFFFLVLLRIKRNAYDFYYNFIIIFV